MAALCRPVRKFAASRTTTYHQQFFCSHYLLCLQQGLPAGKPVDQTLHGFVVEHMGQTALVTGNTAANLVDCFGSGLIRPIRVGHQGPAEPHHITLLQRQDGFRLHRVVVPVGRQDRDGNRILDRLGQVDISPSGHLTRKLWDNRLMPTAGNIQQIHAYLLQLFAEGDTVLISAAAADKIVASHPDHDGVIRPHRIPDSLNQLYAKPAAVVKASAVRILPLVGHR